MSSMLNKHHYIFYMMNFKYNIQLYISYIRKEKDSYSFYNLDQNMNIYNNSYDILHTLLHKKNMTMLNYKISYVNKCFFQCLIYCLNSSFSILKDHWYSKSNSLVTILCTWGLIYTEVISRCAFIAYFLNCTLFTILKAWFASLCIIWRLNVFL